MREDIEALDNFFEKLFGKGVNTENLLRRTICVRLIYKNGQNKKNLITGNISEVCLDSTKDNRLYVSLKLSNNMHIYLSEAAIKEEDGSTYGQLDKPRCSHLIDVVYGNVQILVL